MKILVAKVARWLILSLTLVLVGLSVYLSFQINTNYDMTEYLPSDSQTLAGIEVIEDTFGNYAQIEMMIKYLSIEEALTIKQKVLNVSGVVNVVWMDDYININDPASIPDELSKTYYHNSHPRMLIILQADVYEPMIEDIIKEIDTLTVDEEVFFRGDAMDHIASREISENETIKIILIIIPICFIILIFASRSWIEPVIILATLGIGVIINMGTNAFLPNVSFITLTIAAALQLAISLDYSLFYIHRYYEFIDGGEPAQSAAHKAFKKALPVISASAMTTIIGFVALFFMRYKIGLDIGVVLTKGILLSYLSVILVLPAILVTAHPLIEKFRHRHLMFHLQGLKQFFYRFRYGILVLFILILSFGIVFQSQTKYLFGNASYTGEQSDVAVDRQEIGQHYDAYQTITVLLKDSSKDKELSLINQFNQLENVHQIDALYTSVPPATPESMIPDYIKASFEQDDYSRMMIYTPLIVESDLSFELNDQINNIIRNDYDTYYTLGMIPSTSEIRDTVIEDTPIVLLVSIGLIFIVLVIVFKNIILSFILILVIQAAIWLNVGLLAVNDRQVIYIGYIVVLALQLGATIDYAVLFASRYKSYRNTHQPIESLGHSLKKTSIPIMISGLVLAGAGFAEMLFSDIQVISDIGLLIGRGALLSLALVLFILPSLLLIFDRWLMTIKVIDKSKD
ncbi:MAG TPA: MMPL family transporter [Candidatus Izemoplasmatales bacterium]|nr:MMPL family transporter [Candidatus Izemoplasmatales bacterium]